MTRLDGGDGESGGRSSATSSFGASMIRPTRARRRVGLKCHVPRAVDISGPVSPRCLLVARFSLL